MKKLLFMVISALPALISAQTTVYTGVVKDLTGATVTSGRITWTLNSPSGGAIPGTGSFVSSTVSCGISAAGHPVATSDGVSACVITNNTVLTPTGTSYTMCYQPGYVTPGSCIVTYATGGSVDVSTIVPTSATQPNYGVAQAGVNYNITSLAGLTSLNSSSATVGNLNGCIWVDGTHYAQTNAGIQAAATAAGSGGCVYLPPATYAMSSAATITIPVSILCAPGANLQLAAGAGAVPLLMIAPAAPGTTSYPWLNVSVGMKVQGCQFTTATPGVGTYAIDILTTTAGSLDNLIIEGNYVAPGFGTGALAILNPTGTGGYWNTQIMNNTMFGSVTMTRAGDAINIHHNRFWTQHTNDLMSADFAQGATSFRLEDNTLTFPVHLGAYTQHALIDGNEFETQSKTLIGSNGAMLDIDGTSLSNATGVEVRSNSFQIVNSSTLNAIRLNYAAQVDIGGKSSPNNFGIGTTPAYGIVTTANAFANRVNHNIYSSSSWATILNDVATNTQVTEDANLNGTLGTIPIISQGSAGGVYLSGFYGPAFEGINGANHITDGTSGSNITATFSGSASSAPVNGTFASVANLHLKQSFDLNGGTSMTGNHGNGTSVQHSDGTGTNGNFGKWDANGNTVDAALAVTAVPQKVNTCGTTTTCSNTAQTSPRIVWGTVTLTGGTATVTSMTAFTSTTSFVCTGTDATAAAAVKIVNASTSSITITGTTTDVINYICAGN